MVPRRSEQLQLDSFRFQKSSKKSLRPRGSLSAPAASPRRGPVSVSVTRRRRAFVSVPRRRRGASAQHNYRPVSAPRRRRDAPRRRLRQAMFWKKVKIYLLITFVVLVILYIFLAVICGAAFEKCGNDDDK